MKAPSLLVSAALLGAILSCDNPSSSGKTEEGDSLCYGDSVCVNFNYTTADSAGARILRFVVSLRNVSKRTLALDSDEYATYVKIYRDTVGEPMVWVAPESVKPDSVTPTVILAPDSSCRYRATWPRLDYFNRPVGRGDYLIKGSILGFRAEDLEYREL